MYHLLLLTRVFCVVEKVGPMLKKAFEKVEVPKGKSFELSCLFELGHPPSNIKW